jgi:putative alpha-1,2-mannosidase
MKGFTINRMEGTGCIGAGGNILVKPGLGAITKSGYLYDKASEIAAPGYYKVTFTDLAITAELTATNGTGWQKFSFNHAGNGWLMIDLSHSFEKITEEKHQVEGNHITGSIQAPTVCRNDGGIYKFYYDVEIDRKADSVRVDGSVVWYFFKVKSGDVVNVETSVSSVSPAQASYDRRMEVGNAGFEIIRKKAADAWNRKLSKIKVKGNPEYVKLFYTHYYHSLLSPSNLSGPSGNYRGSDGLLYEARDYIHYHGWSIWDNFRTDLPLLTITEPEIMNDLCRSLTDLYREGKYQFASRTEPFPTARTEHAVAVLLDCYVKGINKFDLEGVYPFLVKEAGKYPLNSPDKKLESYFDYRALAKIAAILNKNEDAKKYSALAGCYKEIWREKFLNINGKSDIMHGDGLYEGTLWQYRWFVPYDIKGVAEMMGGRSVFTDQLEYFFDHNLYSHGNQPDIHVPFLFNVSGKPWLTQKIVNTLLTKKMEQWYGTHVKWEKPYNGRVYQLAPEGYIPEMDDDAGTMSAWYVLAAMGIYPACVGEPVYFLSAPIFSSVEIQLADNKSFRITARNVSDENFYHCCPVKPGFINFIVRTL